MKSKASGQPSSRIKGAGFLWNRAPFLCVLLHTSLQQLVSVQVVVLPSYDIPHSEDDPFSNQILLDERF